MKKQLMLEKFKDKEICVLGYGVEGKATLEYLKSKGFIAAVCDKKEKDELIRENPELTDVSEIFGGENYLKALVNFDIVFKTPGISPEIPEIKEAERSGVLFTSQIELFFDLCPCPIIGVTGTKGKGTTSTLTYEMLLNSGRNVYLGGNIGVPAISFLDQLEESSIVVLELSSFQLQVLKKSPEIAVVLMVTSEHLDYHKSMEEYREAKKNIMKFQKEEDFAVINHDYPVTREFAKATKSKVYFISKKEKTNGCYLENDQIMLETSSGPVAVVNINQLQLRGRHNLDNVNSAIMASHLAGVSLNSIQETVKEFKGLEHRLEFVRELNGVKFYNDSFSTAPEATIAAVKSFEEPIILIAGGSSKKSDYAELGKVIANSTVKKLILIGDSAEEIQKTLPTSFKGEVVLGLSTMEDVVNTAVTKASSGDVILLSPACASFGLFKNYKDRGEQFKQIVNSL